ncbi:MAG: hypothetical protein ABEJ80_06860 [Halarchaeum sp.]
MSTAPASYQPGRCNIGGRERKRRYAYAAVALAAAALFALGTLLGPVPDEVMPAVFVPLALGIEWYLQASRKFCAVLAMLGRYSFEESDAAGTVDDPSKRRADRTTAFRMTATSVVAAALITAALFVAV